MRRNRSEIQHQAGKTAFRDFPDTRTPHPSICCVNREGSSESHAGPSLALTSVTTTSYWFPCSATTVSVGGANAQFVIRKINPTEEEEEASPRWVHLCLVLTFYILAGYVNSRCFNFFTLSILQFYCGNKHTFGCFAGEGVIDEFYFHSISLAIVGLRSWISVVRNPLALISSLSPIAVSPLLLRPLVFRPRGTIWHMFDITTNRLFCVKCKISAGLIQPITYV